MTTRHSRLWTTVALVALLGSGCSDDHSSASTNTTSKVGPAIKQTGKDVAEATKEVGNKIGDGLAEAADGLETFAKSLASNVKESATDVGNSIQAKMPDLEKLVDQAKLKLNAAGAESKELAGKLDTQLAALKTKLADLGREGAQATQQLKDEVVAGFQELVASIKNGLAKLKT